MKPIAADPSPDVPFMLSISERSRLASGRRLRTGGAQGHIVWHAWEPTEIGRAHV